MPYLKIKNWSILFILKMLVVNYINQTSEVKRDGRRDPECKIAARQTKSE